MHFVFRRVAHDAGHRPGPTGRTVGQILRSVQLRGRDRETGPESTAGADDVVRPVGQRPGAGSAPVGQRPANATAGRSAAAGLRAATPLDQVEVETSVPHVVQPRLVSPPRHGQPILVGVAIDRRSPVRQQSCAARAHSHQTDGQVVAEAADRAQSDGHRTARRAVCFAVVVEHGFSRQKTKEQKTMIGLQFNYHYFYYYYYYYYYHNR